MRTSRSSHAGPGCLAVASGDGLPPGEELCSYHESQAHCPEGMEPRQHSLTLTATVSNLTRVVRKAQKCSFGDFE